jgi:hypothetical protein
MTNTIDDCQASMNLRCRRPSGSSSGVWGLVGSGPCGIVIDVVGTLLPRVCEWLRPLSFSLRIGLSVLVEVVVPVGSGLLRLVWPSTDMSKTVVVVVFW